MIHKIRQALQEESDPKRVAFLPGFFKAIPGGYGEGDRFMGVSVPHQRNVAKNHFRQVDLSTLHLLMEDPFHECRLTALFILILKYQKATSATEKESLVDFYLDHLSAVNNWDLVDASAHWILGVHLMDRDKGLLYELARSKNLWEQRVAIIATLHFIKNHCFEHTLNIAHILLHHPHDLIHKAVGWMLREVGKKDFATEYDFLCLHYHNMPRTMLRYAIEKFPNQLRLQFLKGEI